MKIRPISINAVDNGYIVHVGCKTLVTTSRKELLSELARYFENPEKVEKEYYEKYGWTQNIVRQDSSKDQCEAGALAQAHFGLRS